MNMNETQAVIFVSKKRINGGHETVIVWERGDIEDFRDSLEWIETASCTYNTETNEIVEMWRD